MKPPKLPRLGKRVASSCSFFVNLESLLKQNLAHMELVFYPEDGTRIAEPVTVGKGAFQFGDQTPLVWTCTWGEFKDVVAAHGFCPYKDDPLAFQNPLKAKALESVA